MNDIVVMYHYVRDRNGWKGSVPIEPNDFRAQIEWLKERYSIISPDEISLKTDKPKCIISFDDATKDQYLNAYPILKELKVPGYFTVMSAPLIKGLIPIFHLVHTVLSYFTDESIWNELNQTFVLPNLENESGYYDYEKDIHRKYNKYVLNFYLSEIESRSFLESKVREVFGSLENFIENFYISKEEFIDMVNNGMVLGVHCHEHLPYKGNPEEFYKLEIEPCKRFMIEELGVIPKYYTPAFGGGERPVQMKNELESILIQNGFKGAFTTKEQYTNLTETDFWYDRFDCNRPTFIKKINIL